MDVVLLTPIRLLADGLTACFREHGGITVCGVANGIPQLRDLLANVLPQLLLVDVTQGVDLDGVRRIAVEHDSLAIVALGLVEQRQDVIRCGRAGFAGYVSRDATAGELCSALCDVMAGRLACPAEISSGLLQALFRAEHAANGGALGEALTRREHDVLELLGRGLSNKEIARELVLSVATVKHHVHRILEKLKLQRRAQVMQRVRPSPWASAAAVAADGSARPPRYGTYFASSSRF